MCYFKATDFEPSGISFLGQSFSLEDSEELLKPVDDGFDYDDSLVLRKVPGKDDIELVPMEWGFLPFSVHTREEAQRYRNGYKDEQGRWQKGKTLLNARGELMLEPFKVYRQPALQGRCLVPATGFYESRHVIVMGKRGQPLKTPAKFPYYIHLPARPQFWFLGVYHAWLDRSTGELTNTMAIVTTKANEGMAVIHNSKERMPTIPDERMCRDWLLGNLSEQHITEIATYQASWREMAAYTIAKDFKTSASPKQLVQYTELNEDVLP